MGLGDAISLKILAMCHLRDNVVNTSIQPTPLQEVLVLKLIQGGKRTARGRATGLRPALEAKVQPVVTGHLANRFATEGASGWVPLAPATRTLRTQPGRGRGGRNG